MAICKRKISAICTRKISAIYTREIPSALFTRKISTAIYKKKYRRHFIQEKYHRQFIQEKYLRQFIQEKYHHQFIQEKYQQFIHTSIKFLLTILASTRESELCNQTAASISFSLYHNRPLSLAVRYSKVICKSSPFSPVSRAQQECVKICRLPKDCN